MGFVKGVGRGIFSVPFRVMGGAFSVPAYAMKGLYQEMLKDKGATVQNYIIAARISQGYDEASTVSAQERADIISRWKCIRLNVKKKKNPGEEKIEALHTLMQERRKKKSERWAKVNSHFKRPSATPSFPASLDNISSSSLPEVVDHADARDMTGADTAAGAAPERPTPFQPASTFPQALSSHPPAPEEAQAQAAAEEEAERRELEAAIAASVAETSRGNPEEDELVTRAIRASMAELEREPQGVEDEEQALHRAMTASLEEAQRSGVSEEEQKVLEETLRQSLLETSHRIQRKRNSDSEWDESDTEDDEDYQRIIAESKEMAHMEQGFPVDYYQATGGARPREDGDIDANAEEEAMKKAIEESEKAMANGSVDPLAEEEALRKAIEESEKAEQERMQELERQKTEEDIVLEYVKKQSLAEAEHQRRMREGRDTVGESSSSGGAGRT